MPLCYKTQLHPSSPIITSISRRLWPGWQTYLLCCRQEIQCANIDAAAVGKASSLTAESASHVLPAIVLEKCNSRWKTYYQGSFLHISKPTNKMFDRHTDVDAVLKNKNLDQRRPCMGELNSQTIVSRLTGQTWFAHIQQRYSGRLPGKQVTAGTDLL